MHIVRVIDSYASTKVKVLPATFLVMLYSASFVADTQTFASYGFGIEAFDIPSPTTIGDSCAIE